ncbi:MAG: CehA/McbA family metallohydrolase, partial [Chitinophagaceae bacterium]
QFSNKLKILNFLLLFHPVFVDEAKGQKQVLDSSMHIVRIGDKPEWEEFYNQSSLKELTIKFIGHENLKEQTLQLRQYDVKQSWQLVLNGNKLGTLVADVNNMIIYFSIPAKAIVSGQNTLQVLPASPEPDDILVGEIMLHERQLQQVLNEAKIDVVVTDKKNSGTIPCRITVVNEYGVLQMAGVEADKKLAIRPGNIYTLDGKVTIGLPAGKYTIYAGQGFEYSVDSIQIVIKPGERLQKKLIIIREVNTKGWISSDPHIHTCTYSGHGDATIRERALTIAGEGIEFPIITDHNIKVDISQVMDSIAINRYYTPVTGMEFTTNLGHFNVFPVSMETPVPNPQLKDWDSLTNMLNANGSKIIILNHARDIHKGFRPFDQARHLAIAGKSLSGWKFPANAMEVINSGSLQSNDFRLLQDWLGMINRGHFLTPVGSSDSHDVSRYLVGQARTYIKVSDDKPDQINKDEAIRNFRAGKCAVSLGLFTGITINNKYGAGELVPPTNQISVTVQVLGPAWTSVSRISLYANGKKIREVKITNKNKPGIKWKETWILPKFKHDVFLVAIAEGPYDYLPFWPLVKPFQPASTKWTPVVIGSTGAVWIDTDGDGLRTCAFQNAKVIWQKSKGNINTFIRLLNSFDEATAVQAASILMEKGWSLEEPGLKKALSIANPGVKKGFQNFLDEWTKTKFVQ